MKNRMLTHDQIERVTESIGKKLLSSGRGCLQYTCGLRRGERRSEKARDVTEGNRNGWT